MKSYFWKSYLMTILLCLRITILILDDGTFYVMKNEPEKSILKIMFLLTIPTI